MQANKTLCLRRTFLQAKKRFRRTNNNFFVFWFCEYFFQTTRQINHLHLPFRSTGLSPFRDQLFDGDVGPHLFGETCERVLLLGQLGVQLCSVGVGL